MTDQKATIAKITELQDNSMATWDTCVWTCLSPEGDLIVESHERAKVDADSAAQSWALAIAAATTGDIELALIELRAARYLASEWGDSQYEDAAIALLEAQR